MSLGDERAVTHLSNNRKSSVNCIRAHRGPESERLLVFSNLNWNAAALRAIVNLTQLAEEAKNPAGKTVCPNTARGGQFSD